MSGEYVQRQCPDPARDIDNVYVIAADRAITDEGQNISRGQTVQP